MGRYIYRASRCVLLSVHVSNALVNSIISHKIRSSEHLKLIRAENRVTQPNLKLR